MCPNLGGDGSAMPCCQEQATGAGLLLPAGHTFCSTYVTSLLEGGPSVGPPRPPTKQQQEGAGVGEEGGEGAADVGPPRPPPGSEDGGKGLVPGTAVIPASNIRWFRGCSLAATALAHILLLIVVEQHHDLVQPNAAEASPAYTASKD
jgi:hypothetical protein